MFSCGSSALGFSTNRDGSARGAEAERDLYEWICLEAGITDCLGQVIFNGKKQSERWIGGPVEGAERPRRIPGGDWKWYPDKKNSRGGVWRDPDGRSASWDPQGHWDVDDGKGNRTRYDSRGNPTKNHRPPTRHLPKPIRRLGRGAGRVLGPLGVIWWLGDVISDPSILRGTLLVSPEVALSWMMKLNALQIGRSNAL